ncbi:MAG: hypothetical protein IJB97_11065 [Clostridia bacterium]|nr:hypothetical protein [Clostridia bacterium]
MKKVNQAIAFVALASVLSTTALGFVGCGNKVANDENTLEIFIENFGYGYEWLNDEIELFKKQDWVKEKYPNLNIPKIAYNSKNAYAAERVVSGKNANSVDLFFAITPSAGYYSRTDNSGNLYFEDMASFYDTKIPGEELTVKQKMRSDLVDMQYIEKFDGGKTYYAVPWVDGWMGIMYNKTLVDQYLGADYQLPRTTVEFLEMTTDIKNANVKSGSGRKATPFVTSSKVSYWTEIFVTWWAQYEGVQGYNNFWNGVDEYENRSSDIFKQYGRLRSLEALESLIGVEAGNNHADVNTLEFTIAQAKFLLGEGVMMPNGDWLESEMRSTADENPYDYDITFMKTPVVSAIVEKMDLWTEGENVEYDDIDATKKAAYDEKLASIITAVDEEKTFAEAAAVIDGLTESDYAKVTEARKVIYKIKGHEAFIPAYATAKGLAKDFLLFLATDTACEQFMKSTNGCGVPYHYDVQTKSPELYNGLSQMHKDRIAIMDKAIKLMPLNSFRLVNYGGLSYFCKTPLLDVVFTAKNPADRKTASQVWQEDIDFYTSSGGANWASLLIAAGL